ncbi:twin-arginine translocase TatA/TatE family subunit [Demequina sp. NBRC 110056]|uniref:twin-arginine translocase TatA/TatE family subunit n=1 Tax=Demequina sp. NBRC 110056 TaxID=1570345 RepID=UPI000A03572D|nr:twin-arginine translocase TatA/TatE family subunit [Demequina sp. NBRC 110056]
MFGINGWEFLVLILVAIIVIGPERMPEYARQLREWVVSMRDLVNLNKDRLKNEIGDDVDWKQYDPRQYDPRRIVREALYEPSPTAAAEPAAAAAAAGGAAAAGAAAETARPAPFDSEAT